MPKNYPVTNLNTTDISEKHSFEIWGKELKNQKFMAVQSKNPKHVSKKKIKHAKIKTKPSKYTIPKKKKIGKIILLSSLMLMKIIYIYSKINADDEKNAIFDNDVGCQTDLIHTGCQIQCNYTPTNMAYLIHVVEAFVVDWPIFFVFTLIYLCYSCLVNEELLKSFWNKKYMKIFIYSMMIYSLILCTHCSELSSVSSNDSNRKPLLTLSNSEKVDQCVQLIIREYGQVARAQHEMKIMISKNLCKNFAQQAELKQLLPDIVQKHSEFLCLHELMMTEDQPLGKNAVTKFCEEKFPSSGIDIDIIQKEYDQYLCIQTLYQDIQDVEEGNFEADMESNLETCQNYETNKLGFNTKLEKFIECWGKYGHLVNDMNFKLGHDTECTIFSKMMTEKHKKYVDKLPDRQDLDKNRTNIKIIIWILSMVSYFVTIIDQWAKTHINTAILLGVLLPSGLFVFTITYAIITLHWSFKKCKEILMKQNFIAFYGEDRRTFTRPGPFIVCYKFFRIKKFYTNFDVNKVEISWIMALRSMVINFGFFLASMFQLIGSFLLYHKWYQYDIMQIIILSLYVTGFIGLQLAEKWTIKSDILTFRRKKGPPAHNCLHFTGALIAFIAYGLAQLTSNVYLLVINKTVITYKDITILAISFVLSLSTFYALIKWIIRSKYNRNPYQWNAAMCLILNLLLQAFLSAEVFKW